jgi:glycosyltransferase involved in cell wall biosynthesis
MIKLVYCASQLYRPGGTEKVLVEKVNYLAANTDFEIYIITENQLNKSFYFELNSKIKVYDMNVSSLNKIVIPGLTFILNVFTLRKLFALKLKEINPDFVIVVERGYLDFVIPFINVRGFKIREFHFAKKAVEYHTKLMKGFFKRTRHFFRYQLLFKMFDKYDYLILLTDQDRKEGNYKTKTKVIHNMINVLPERVSDLSSKRVISVGSMYDKRKNFKEQILLWRKIKVLHPDWTLNIYGDGNERAYLQELINKWELTSHVILHGNSNEMPKNYFNSSIFLFTSQAEGFPMVLIEALSNGLPCIVYDTPTGPKEIIKNNENGFVVENGNLNELEQKLSLLISDNKIRMKMGINARINCEKYLPNSVMKKWIDFFKKLKNEKNSHYNVS